MEPSVREPVYCAAWLLYPFTSSPVILFCPRAFVIWSKCLSGQPPDAVPDTVLIVDDEPLVAVMMSQAFQDAGYNPLVAHNALSALELLEVSGQRIVLMVTDVRMPGAMDGLELGHLAVERYPDLAVLTMTGYALEDERSAVGAVLQKPFKLDHLLQVARRIVEDGRYWREMMKPR